jgi:hypothetical protein
MLVYMYIKSLVDLARTPLLLSSCDLLVPIFSVDHKLLKTRGSLLVVKAKDMKSADHT